MENDLEAFKVFEAPINSQSYIETIKDCSRYAGRFAVFGDNVSYHASAEAMASYRRLDTKFIANIAFAPELSPVESFFSAMKRKMDSVRSSVSIY